MDLANIRRSLITSALRFLRVKTSYKLLDSSNVHISDY